MSDITKVIERAKELDGILAEPKMLAGHEWLIECRALLPQVVAEVERLKYQNEKLTELRLIEAGPSSLGGFEFRMEDPSRISGMIAYHFQGLLDGHEAINYVEQRFTASNGGPDVIVTIQRPEGKTPHALRVEAEAARDEALDRAKVPEWRPLSVLTMEAVKQHTGAWALRSGPAGLPALHWLNIETLAPDYKTLGIICPHFEDGKIPHYITECRPVNCEGIPVPWAKVGL